jgi:hypothetical protein
MPKHHTSKERTEKEFEDEIKEAMQKSESHINRIPKTNYCCLLGTKEGFEILKKMSWVDIEELTDYEFFGE